MKLCEIPLDDHHLIMNAKEVLKHVDENTIGVVTTLGITYFCKADCVSVFKISVKVNISFYIYIVIICFYFKNTREYKNV